VAQGFLKLWNFVEALTAIVVGRAFLEVDAIYGTGVDAGGVLCPDAEFGNDIGHTPPPLSHPRYASRKEDSSRGHVLWRVRR